MLCRGIGDEEKGLLLPPHTRPQGCFLVDTERERGGEASGGDRERERGLKVCWGLYTGGKDTAFFLLLLLLEKEGDKSE